MRCAVSMTCSGLAIVAVVALLTHDAIAAEPQFRDFEYASVNEHSLLLDLYQPKTARNADLIVWVHGGAWRSGSKDSVPITRLLDHGFAIASVNYRLSPVAMFPAQVHDIKAAVRFLRAHAGRYQINADRIIIAGASAGGHLAALVGVSNGVSELEGTVGQNLDSSSDVQGIISFYGASNLQTILSQSTPHGLSVRVPALQLLLGGQPSQCASLAQLASPVQHVDENDPALLLIHGDQDPQMPINQAHELHGKYKQLQRPVKFEVIHGGAHGGTGFFDDATMDRIAHYLKTGDWP